uniref:Aminopeptidase N n=1 Tax=Glossina brevipalpis TaxID=37001 RepID=A0A1A9WJU5_9MUSC
MISGSTPLAITSIDMKSLEIKFPNTTFNITRGLEKVRCMGYHFIELIKEEHFPNVITSPRISMSCLIISIFLSTILICLATSAELNIEHSYNHYRLPTSIQPNHYNLKIITFFDNPPNLTFSGEVAIRFTVLADTNNLTLHSQNLIIDQTHIQLKTLDDNRLYFCGQYVDIVPEHNYYIINQCRRLLAGEEAEIKISFRGTLNDQLNGYYRSSYKVKRTNETKWLSVTQFEPAFARTAFPCFDEPNYKAKFKIWLGHHRSMIALSNMPMERQQPMQVFFILKSDMTDYMWSIFEESVPMSTYLVAYTVHDFAYKSSGDSNVMFRTWSRPEAIDQCDYASTIGPKILKFYERIFAIPYPLKKLDQFAVPDLGAGAMENWGLITYREAALLFAENISSETSRQRIADIIAHELAHQWFGNLVTMKWWSDLWLNEGFATYIASLGVAFLNPQWGSLNEEALDNTLTVFRRDSQFSSHPISLPIESTHQIAERFDTISYKKGAAALRMIHMILGEDAFFQGIRRYLLANVYKNAEQDDLWAALTERAHLLKRIDPKHDMKIIMDSWTLQVGYPLVRVRRDYVTGLVKITQQRFLQNNTYVPYEAQKCWWIPLTYTTASKMDFSTSTPSEWLQCNQFNQQVQLTMEDVAAPNEWILFNIQLSGLYRVMYDFQNWAMLNQTLNSNKFQGIHVLNRAQLIDDILWLAWGGYTDYDITFDFLSYMTLERHYIPWRAGLESLSHVNRLLRSFHPTYETFQHFMRTIIKPVYYYLNGLNYTRPEYEMPHITILHKSLISSWACRLEILDCVNTAIRYFDEWKRSTNPRTDNHIPVDIRPIVYCTSIRHGNKDDWNFLWKIYLESNVASEKHAIIFSLSCSYNGTLLRTYIEMTYDKNEYIKRQDSTFAFSSIARNEIGYHLAKDYFINNIDKLYELFITVNDFKDIYFHFSYGPHNQELGNLLSPLASQVVKYEDRNQLIELIEKKRKYFRKSESIVLKALETIHHNLDWIKRNVNYSVLFSFALS